MNEMLIPKLGIVTEIRRDTPDIKTFTVTALEGGKVFEHMPGQCAMLSIPGVGEAMFSITSSPTVKTHMEFSIKKCGCLTEWLHAMEVGQMVTIRGPYGNPFPVEEDLVGHDLIFIAGGVGLAPLHSVINYCLDKKKEDPNHYGKIDIVYGSRSADDLLDRKEIEEVWLKTPGLGCYITIDRPQEGWDGHVGFVPNYAKEVLEFDPDKKVLVCGPPIMIKFTVAGLLELGFKPEQIYTTMELRMKCGIGKCGRCNIGDKYVCKDGPVFRYDKLGELPNEY